MRRFVLFLLAALCFSGGASGQSGPTGAALVPPPRHSDAPTASALPAPSLIVLITIDQFRWDYLDRFGPQLRGGLARLASTGAWFTNAHHDHAITETAPGHATLLSGRFPRSTGIISNRVGVEDDAAPLLGEPTGTGASPQRFQGTTLVDWLRKKDSDTRTLSVSMKDRAAILPVGRSRAEVYWYYPDGTFTTSRYYRDTLPDWVNRFNARRLPQSFAGKRWTLLLPDTAYKEPDSVSIELGGKNFVFPHVFDSAAVASLIRVSPWMDEITLDFALEGLSALSLGQSPRTDVLAISLSATDLIGHGFGPDSREMHDNVLRLDRNLGVFFDSLFKLRLRTLVAAARIDTTRVDLDQQIVLADRNALKKREAGLDSALAVFALQAKTLPGIGRIDRFRDLLHGDTINDPIARRWVHQFPAQSNVEMVITLTPFSTWGGNVASHGSPYDYDTHVPIIFAGPWFATGRYPEFVRTVDIAPTLAEIAGVRPSERIDGVVLRRALKANR